MFYERNNWEEVTMFAETTVQNYIATDMVCSLSREFTVKDAAKALVNNQCSALFIINDAQQVEGIITEHDMVKFLINSNDTSTKLKDICTTELKTISKNTNLQEALSIMIKSKIRHLPVVENNNIIGLVSLESIYQIVNYRIDEDLKEINAFMYKDRYAI